MNVKIALWALALSLLPALASAQTEPPVVPVIDGVMRAHILSILSSAAGVANFRDSFAKVGDSITETGSYLKDVGCESPPDASAFSSYSSLMPVASYFDGRTFPSNYANAWCGISNSFTRASLVSQSGTTSNFPFVSTTACAAPYNTVLRCEYRLLRPSYALIMFGTNDVMASVNSTLTNALASYRTNMQAIVDQSIAAGVVPVLSTIPPLRPVSGVTQAMVDRVDSYNQVVISIASSSNTPLWNYHRAMMDLGAAANYGVSADGIHPSIYRNSLGAVFTAAALVYGYNVRNLNSLQVLAALKAAVDGTSTLSAPTISTTALPGGTVGAAYGAALSASGNPTPTYRATGLPPGISLNATTGALAGTPTTSGTSSVIITATNGQSPDATRTLSLVIAAQSALAAPTLGTTSLPGGTVGVAYSATLSATGNPRPTFRATGLPPGITLNATTGALSGTPTGSSTWSVVVTATNAQSPDASRTLSLVIVAASRGGATITSACPPVGHRGVAYSYRVTATGSPTPWFTYENFPDGVYIDVNTGTMFGTPSMVGSWASTVIAVSDGYPETDQTCTIVIQ